MRDLSDRLTLTCHSHLTVPLSSILMAIKSLPPFNAPAKDPLVYPPITNASSVVRTTDVVTSSESVPFCNERVRGWTGTRQRQ